MACKDIDLLCKCNQATIGHFDMAKKKPEHKCWRANESFLYVRSCWKE